MKPLPPVKQEVLNPRWQCVFCPQAADLMHKGTTYCRTCYDHRNSQGKLVG